MHAGKDAKIRLLLLLNTVVGKVNYSGRCGKPKIELLYELLGARLKGMKLAHEGDIRAPVLTVSHSQRPGVKAT